MKKILLASVALVWGGAAMASTTPDPAQFPGGLSGKNIIYDSASTFNGQTVTSALNGLNTTSSNAVPKAWIGANTTSSVTGVAPLDTNGNSTANVLTSTGTFGTASQTTYPSLFIGQDMTSVLGSPLVGNTTLQIGGAPMPTIPGAPLAQTGLPQSVTISSHPDGAFNKGYALGIFTDGAYQNSMLAELGGDDYENGTGLVPAGLDTASIYWEANARRALLKLTATAYTNTTVTISGKLSTEQLMLIKQGQYIVTNSKDPNATATETWDAPHFLAGVVKSVDNSGTNAVINVWAWNRLGQSGTSNVPSLTSFDTTYFPNTTTPTVFIGAPTKVFSFNTMMQYDGARTGAGTEDTSAVHQLEWGEVDVNLQNETRAGALSYHGLTFGGSQTVPVNSPITASQVFADDSYEILLANDMPHHLKISEACGNMAIESSGFYLPGLCNLYTATPDSNSLQARDIVEYKAQSSNTSTGATYNWRIPMYLTSADGSYDYTHDTLHFGPRINGTMGTVDGTDTASVLGEIQFSGLNGGISLCGYGTACGVVMDGTGAVSFPKGNVSVTGQFSALGNFVMRGTQYFQDTSGTNAASLTVGTDAGITINSLNSSATITNNLPLIQSGSLTVNNNITSSGTLTVAGDTTLDDNTTSNGQLSALGNFVMRNTQYFQDSNGKNAAELVVGTDSGITLAEMSDTAQLINNLPLVQNGKSTFSADTQMEGSLTVSGNSTFGGNGGKFEEKDPAVFDGTLNVDGQFESLGTFVSRGPIYFQDSTGVNSAEMVMGTDGGITLSAVSSNAKFINNLPTTLNGTTQFNQDVTVGASETVSGNLTVGGNSGNTTLKDNVILPSLAGTGNAYACLNASGQLYRSTTACN